MEQLTEDLACFVKFRDNWLQRVIRVHLSHSIGIANDELIKESLQAFNLFESKGRRFGNIKCVDLKPRSMIKVISFIRMITLLTLTNFQKLVRLIL